MRVVCCAVVLMVCGSASGQSHSIFDLPGRLQLLDQPPEATPVEAVLVGLHSLERGYVIQAAPNSQGRFVLKNVKPGRYSLTLPFPGRIRSFTNNSRELGPDGFDLSSNNGGPLRIVVSLKTSDVSVKARGLPIERSGVIVLLAPADPYLTLRESCTSNTLTEPLTTIRSVPPGKYRIFIVDAQFQSDVAAYAPRFPDFLRDRATPVEVSEKGGANATATYVDGETIKQAIHQAGPIR